MKRLKYKLFKWLGIIQFPKIIVFGENETVVFLACMEFVKQWKIHYGQDIEYLFHGIVINFQDTPVLGADGKSNFGMCDPLGVTIWKNVKSIGDTALVHELIHYINRELTGDPDNQHKGQAWGENFESPVKRILKSKDL